MFKSYLRIGWRNLWKHKSLFSINVIGLALGIATCLVILLFVADELSFDRFHAKADRIVRIVLKGQVNGEVIKEAVTAAPVATTLKNELPEVIESTRIRNFGSRKVTYKNQTFRDSRMAFVDPNFFKVFTFPLLQGDPNTVLNESNTIVITRTQAERYFGKEDPLNKLLVFDDGKELFRVTGVIEEVPANSHFHFDLFASMTGLEHARVDDWMQSNYFTYAVLSPGTDVTQLESKLPAIVEKYMGPQFEQMGMTYKKFRDNGNEIGLFVQKLTDIHLYSDFAGTSELEPGGNVQSIYIFTAVAVFMLVIALINFMNLSTAGATKRSKEIGVKKLMGSQRKQLIHQFLMEAAISTAVAMAIAAVLVIFALPVFNSLSGKSLSIAFLLSPSVMGLLAIMTIVITFLAGSYPAFYLSSINPLSALKNRFTPGGQTKNIRSGLVVFQFVISAGLILAILIVNQQMHFIQNKEVGYDRNNLIVLRDSWMLGKNENAFYNQLKADPRIESVTRSAFIPAGPTDTNMTGVYPGQNHEAVRRTMIYNIDDQYIPTMGMELVAGRNFSSIPIQDSLHVIINETAAKVFGFNDKAVGELLTVKIDDSTSKTYTVTGVIRDFHFRSLHEAIAPLIMLNKPYGGLIVKTRNTEVQALILSMDRTWKEFEVGEPFSFGLLDQLYNETYLQEQKTGQVLQIFGMITIFVACLGLFGLVTFTAEQRIKEIGIRKVLGADISQIVSLLSRDLLVLVSLAFLVAFPLGYYLMNLWLQNFAYRIEIHWWIYAVAGIATLGIAFFTMSFTTIRSALANPVNSLRSE